RAADIGDIERRGEESDGYLDVQAQLNTLRFATGVANVSLIDSTRTTRFDARDNLLEGERSPLDSLAGPALGRALAGRSEVSPAFARGGRLYRVGLAPVRAADGRVAGMVAIEAEANYLPVLDRLGRTLAGTALAILLAIGVLAALVLRGAWSAARLERRLSRAENLAAMGRLTATLAHEIKNPLAIIRGSAERLGRADPEAKRMAEFVIDESDRLSRTVSRYLQFARGAPEPA